MLVGLFCYISRSLLTVTHTGAFRHACQRVCVRVPRGGVQTFLPLNKGISLKAGALQSEASKPQASKPQASKPEASKLQTLPDLQRLLSLICVTVKRDLLI